MYKKYKTPNKDLTTIVTDDTTLVRQDGVWIDYIKERIITRGKTK